MLEPGRERAALRVGGAQNSITEARTHDGFATALLFENVPGGALEPLAHMRYDDDPAAYDKLVLETLRAYYPMAAERVDPAAFGLWSSRDLLQGALTPIVREDYARLSSGRYALAVGDAHTVVDPIMGQGANSASYSAWTIGEAIVADHAYDERFCQRVARRREGFVHSVSDWTNLMLNPPPHVQEFLGAMSQDKALCDEFNELQRPRAPGRHPRHARAHAGLPGAARPGPRVGGGLTCTGRSSSTRRRPIRRPPTIASASPEGEATAADVPNYATGGALLLRYDVSEGEPATPGG